MHSIKSSTWNETEQINGMIFVSFQKEKEKQCKIKHINKPKEVGFFFPLQSLEW